MRILFIQKMAGIAGSETYFLSVLPALRARGIEVEFCCVQHPENSKKNDKFLDALKAAQVPFHIINDEKGISWSILKQLNALIKKHNYDLIQTNLIHADVWGALLKRFFQPKLKVVSFKHGYDEAFQKQNGFDHTKLKKDLFYRAMKWSSGVVDQSVAISEGLGSFLVKGGIVPDSKLEVIHYGFDYSHITIDPTYDQKYRYASNQLVIIGRLVTVKQHDKVIELLPDIHKVLPDLSLVIVGAGEKEEYLKQLVKQLQLTDIVHFEGFKTNTHDYIAASDIMLVPSSAEGFGAVILEGWNNKKPVIAFNVPAPNEIIIHEKNGLLIKPFDAQELKEGILRLLQDKSLTKQFGENGYQLLQEKFSLNAMISKTVRIYERVLTT